MQHLLISTKPPATDAWSKLSAQHWTDHHDTLLKEVNKQKTLIWLDTSTSDWLTCLQSLVTMGLKCVVITKKVTLEELSLAIDCGAKGYCSRVCTSGYLTLVARAVDSGALWLPEGYIAKLIKRFSTASEQQSAIDQENQRKTDCLTAREKQVLNGILTGLSNTEIADVLNISLRTVKEHVSSILHKYEVKDRVALLLEVGQFSKVDTQ